MSALSRPEKQARKRTTSQTNTEPAANPARPLQKSVRIYKAEELDHEALSIQTKAIFGQVAFGWQIEIGAAALCGEDVIVDVGTGCGKSLPFSIPLILHETDIALRVTPLTALMIDQVSTTIVTI
jgi:superfamily II DNA helicase RecQ